MNVSADNTGTSTNIQITEPFKRNDSPRKFQIAGRNWSYLQPPHKPRHAQLAHLGSSSCLPVRRFSGYGRSLMACPPYRSVFHHQRVRDNARSLERGDRFYAGTFLCSTVSAKDGITPCLLFNGGITTTQVDDFQNTYIVTGLPQDGAHAPSVRHRRRCPGISRLRAT